MYFNHTKVYNNDMKTIMVVDGQGGGIGKAIVEKLRRESISANIIAVGTNSVASNAMLKAGADNVSTGENAVKYNAAHCDFIMGPVGIISANSLLGEISPAIAEAIASSSAPKFLIPLNRCNIYIAGVSDDRLGTKMDDLIEKLIEVMKKDVIENGHG